MKRQSDPCESVFTAIVGLVLVLVMVVVGWLAIQTIVSRPWERIGETINMEGKN